MTGIWTRRLEPIGEAFIHTAKAAKTTPMPMRIASWRTTPAGGLASQIR